MEELKKVEVIWEDSWGDQAHLDIDAMIDFAPIVRCNVGLLIKGDKDKVIITSGVINNLFAGKTFIDGIQVIPRKMIKKIKILHD